MRACGLYRAPASRVRLNVMLHVTNVDSARELMERSGVPGSVIVWPDVLHEGPTPLLAGDEWNQLRSRYLASHAFAGALRHVDLARREAMSPAESIIEALHPWVAFGTCDASGVFAL